MYKKNKLKQLEQKMKFLLIQNDTVLTFKTSRARNVYNLKMLLENQFWMIVDVTENFYTIENPYLAGTGQNSFKTQQLYSFDAVLKYCGSFS